MVRVNPLLLEWSLENWHLRLATLGGIRRPGPIFDGVVKPNGFPMVSHVNSLNFSQMESCFTMFYP